ncbi:MAG: carboxypeptidase-like regulatory domain-containing protein [Acidobacteriaceae bacterium]
MKLSCFQIKFRWLLCVALILGGSGILRAQNLTGEIDGVVRDSSGAVVPNATVTIRNTDKNLLERKVSSDGNGQFTAPLLAIGTYSITVEATGFQTTAVSGVIVHVNQPVSIPITLSLGKVTQTINVTASSIAPQTQTAAAGTLIDGTQVRELSLSGRNFEELLSLQPGIAGSTGGRGIISSGGGTNSANFSVNGQASNQNGYFLDGADILNHGGSQQVGVFPGVDAIQEISLLRNSYGAQYGGEGAAIISMATRSGTSDFHGGAYEFFRSQILNANNYFSNLAGVPRPGIRYNNFGFELGGPVWIPHLTDKKSARTFFFIAQEYLRSENQTRETLTNIPTAAQRQGMFSAPVCVQYTGAKCTQSATSISQFDPTAQAYLTDVINKTPLPNNPNDPQGLIASQAGFNNETQTVIRIDHQFNQKLSVFFRYLDDPFHLVVPYGLYQGSGIPGVAISRITDGGTDYLGHATFVMNTHTVMEGGYAYLENWITAQPFGYLASVNSPDINPVLPYVSTIGSVPGLNINGSNYHAAGAYSNPAHNNQVFLNVTSTYGSHTFTFGGNFQSIVVGNNQATTNAGTFTFKPAALPAGSTASQFEQAFANFLLGRVASFQQSSVDPAQSNRGRLYETYFQDDYRVTPRLTLNAGIRYTFNQQPVAVQLAGHPFVPLSNFDPALYNPANAPTIGTNGLICTASPCPGGGTPNPNYDPLNGMIIAGKNSPYGSAVNSQPKLNFAPRFGFAWDIWGNGTTALRGGYGIYYAQSRLGNYNSLMQSNPPFVKNTTITNTSFGAPGNGIPASSSAPLNINATSPNQIIPYVENWSLDVQQQLAKSMVLDIGYYGNRSIHQLATEDINQPLAGEYVQKGIIAGDGVTAGNSTLLNQIRPYPGWGPINSLEPIFSANYNALQTFFTKQFADGNLLNLDYTWAKTLTNYQIYSTSPQDTHNIAAEYGPAPFNRKHIFSANFVYVVPFFRSQQGITGHVLGGWETSGIVSYTSGGYETARTINVDPGGLGLLAAGLQGPSTRPDAVSNPNHGAPHSLHKWFNTAAFAQVPAGQYRPGNAPVGDIVGPGFENWNLSLFKNFHIENSTVMQFRAESFNAFNHTNFTGVANTLGQSNYGQVTGAGEARVIQLALKLHF